MKIALTGGIGAGKSYVCTILNKQGITVYDTDSATKRLMLTNSTLQAELSALIGQPAVVEGKIQKRRIAEFLLASEANKQALNNVVHPYVARDYCESGIEWLESAILFESNFYKRVTFDYIVAVIAPEHVRTERIARRDNISTEKAEAWVKAQMPQEEVARRANYIIYNNEGDSLDKQIATLMTKLYGHESPYKQKRL